MRAIRAVLPEDQRAVVEPGVVNATLTRLASAHGLHYAPDPSSQTACTIGGNVAENAGGPHCLKYGVTLDHVVSVTALLPSGEVVTLGGKELIVSARWVWSKRRWTASGRCSAPR